MPYGFRVTPDEADVAASRRRIVDVVRGWEVPLPEEVFDDLALLASEVVTNAVRHTRATCAVTVRWTGERVRVEVTDTDPARPALRDVSAHAEDGRGLLLVASLSADWGSTPDRAGKTVWFEVGPPTTLLPSTSAARSPAPCQDPLDPLNRPPANNSLPL